MTKKKQPRLPKVIRVGKRKKPQMRIEFNVQPIWNKEQTSARVAQAAGRLLQPSKQRQELLIHIREYAQEKPLTRAPCHTASVAKRQALQDARILLAMLADGVTVAGSALTQRPNKKAR